MCVWGGGGGGGGGADDKFVILLVKKGILGKTVYSKLPQSTQLQLWVPSIN